MRLLPTCLLLLLACLGYCQNEPGRFELKAAYTPKLISIEAADLRYCTYDGYTTYKPLWDFAIEERWHLKEHLVLGLSQNMHASLENTFTSNSFSCGPGEICASDSDLRRFLVSFGFTFGYEMRVVERHTLTPWLEALFVSRFYSSVNRERTIKNNSGGTYVLHDSYTTNIRFTKPVLWGRAGFSYCFYINSYLGISLSPSLEFGDVQTDCLFPSSAGFGKIELRLPVGVSYRF